MNILIGEKIGEGGCSEVFEWENSSKIIKLARANTDINAMKREYHHNLIAWDNGLSVPQPFEILEIDGRPGIVFERIYGDTLMKRFVQNALKRASTEAEVTEDDNYDDVRITAQILSEIHSKSNLSVPSQKETIKKSISWVDHLTSVEKAEIFALLDSLPSKQQLCHGDPNLGNIMIRDGKAIMIDWMNATIGNPEADLAEYIIMIRFAILPSYLPDNAVEYVNTIRESIIKIFIDEYTRLSGITYDEVDSWIAPIAARKLSADGIGEEEKNLLVDEIRRRLSH
ncbi:phosphotransferase family protein [Paenibacillus endoradicis]|uniref:phosphotransferase family protein n=1 Tax=Paenibacillus endoradicis TaxID=2972487 RepID=UPI002158AE4D|nr:aminoglycoside phosphotransferase family protein [Paenibacillus endoradicis]MCR8657373.1 phosphotransferase [Paenibacillus endoradicis]